MNSTIRRTVFLENIMQVSGNPTDESSGNGQSFPNQSTRNSPHNHKLHKECIAPRHLPKVRFRHIWSSHSAFFLKCNEIKSNHWLRNDNAGIVGTWDICWNIIHRTGKPEKDLKSQLQCTSDVNVPVKIFQFLTSLIGNPPI